VQWIASSSWARSGLVNRPATVPTRWTATDRICSAWAFDGFGSPQHFVGSLTWKG
jgi:hypothetical protein